MRFKVPQFIDIEDKIFGPLTWRQFLYVGGGIGMSVVLFFTNLPLTVSLLIGLPLATLSGALAFYPVNNRPFSFFLESILYYLTHQHLYLWRNKEDVVHKKSSPPIQSAPVDQKLKLQQTGGIASLAKRLELQALQKPE